MIALGNAQTADLTFVVDRLRDLVREHGEIAVFIGTNFEIAAAPHYELGYADALARHSTSLVGCYRYDENLRQAELPPIHADIATHLAELDRRFRRRRRRVA